MDPKDSERFVRGLAAAVPEAFQEVDVKQEFGPMPGVAARDGDIGMWSYALALELAGGRVWGLSIDYDRVRDSAHVKPDGRDVLGRFFGFVESEIALQGPAGWMKVALDDGFGPWDDLASYAGPLTVALLTGE